MTTQKKIETIAAAILGLVFVVFGVNFFLRFIPIPPAAEGSPAAGFMGAMYTTGFLAFVKVMEVIGGVLVAIPKTRNLGLLVLGPIIVNILAYHFFMAKQDLFQPPVILVSVLGAFLLWSGREAFCKLLNK